MFFLWSLLLLLFLCLVRTYQSETPGYTSVILLIVVVVEVGMLLWLWPLYWHYVVVSSFENPKVYHCIHVDGWVGDGGVEEYAGQNQFYWNYSWGGLRFWQFLPPSFSSGHSYILSHSFSTILTLAYTILYHILHYSTLYYNILHYTMILVVV